MAGAADHVVVQRVLDALLAHQAAGGDVEVRPVEGPLVLQQRLHARPVP
jgi:hypothetical protein